MDIVNSVGLQGSREFCLGGKLILHASTQKVKVHVHVYHKNVCTLLWLGSHHLYTWCMTTVLQATVDTIIKIWGEAELFGGEALLPLSSR